MLRSQIFLGFALCLAIIFLVNSVVYIRNRVSTFRDVDSHLATASASVVFVLDDDFHDRALNKDSIAPEEDLQNIQRLTSLCRDAKLAYLYTAILTEDGVMITSSSASEEELAEGSEVRYFTPYEEAEYLKNPKLQDQGLVFTTYTDRWGEFRSAVRHQLSPGGIPYIAVAEVRLDEVKRALRLQWFYTLLQSLLLVLATVPLYVFMSSGLRSALRDLQEANDRIEEERKEKNRLERDLFQAQKMESLGTLAGGIAHDFNNILAAIAGSAELALGDVDPDSSPAEDLREIILSADRAKTLIRRILTFSRSKTSEKVCVQIRDVAEDVVAMLRVSCPSNIETFTSLNSSLSVLGDSATVSQVLLNLCVNAYQAMEEQGGELSICLEDAHIDENHPFLEAGEYVRIIVADTGTGIPEENRSRIFEPYFTTKPIGKGTGMGLSMVHGIVTGMKGDVRVSESEDGGAQFDVQLPACKEPCPGKEEPAQEFQGELPRGTGLILMVDDEFSVGRVYTRLLQGLGYEVIFQAQSKTAAQMVESDPARFDLVLTDLTMPDLDGLGLARRIEAVRPDLPVILCSGYICPTAPACVVRILQKPISREMLAHAVAEALKSEA